MISRAEPCTLWLHCVVYYIQSSCSPWWDWSNNLDLVCLLRVTHTIHWPCFHPHKRWWRGTNNFPWAPLSLLYMKGWKSNEINPQTPRKQSLDATDEECPSWDQCEGVGGGGHSHGCHCRSAPEQGTAKRDTRVNSYCREDMLTCYDFSTVRVAQFTVCRGQ